MFLKSLNSFTDLVQKNPVPKFQDGIKFSEIIILVEVPALQTAEPMPPQYCQHLAHC